MKVRVIAVSALCLAATGCDFGGNVYPMTVQQTYEKLVAGDLKPGGKGPFGTLETSVSGDGTSTVWWNASGTFASVKCEANISPEGTDKSKITAYCGGSSPSDGAAAGMMLALERKQLIELIDATLRGRPYDPKRAMGATAGSWPDDPRQADGSIGAAAGEALKMDRDMNREMKKFEEDEALRRANAGVHFKPGEPMINPSK